ncbi:uncharacterized protein CCOS01_03143 [Colletotrichum costaricense]|nr:uncharacterized protein CCOS01_03143 [Colletotrichum costaricense]KAK1534391.1 hypothetical protein CCOS01_03143 [Colletotrichum costaricense]
MIRIPGKKRAWWQLAGAQVVLGCASPPGLLIMWNEKSTFCQVLCVLWYVDLMIFLSHRLVAPCRTPDTDNRHRVPMPMHESDSSRSKYLERGERGIVQRESPNVVDT